jgi:hypothetical protein
LIQQKADANKIGTIDEKIEKLQSLLKMAKSSNN